MEDLMVLKDDPIEDVKTDLAETAVILKPFFDLE